MCKLQNPSYPLVNVYISMKNHHSERENPLEMAMFNSYVRFWAGVLRVATKTALRIHFKWVGMQTRILKTTEFGSDLPPVWLYKSHCRELIVTLCYVKTLLHIVTYTFSHYFALNCEILAFYI